MTVVATTEFPFTVPCTTTLSPTTTLDTVTTVFPCVTFAFVASIVYVTLLLLVMLIVLPLIEVTAPATTGCPLPVKAGVAPGARGVVPPRIGITPSRIVVATRFVPVRVPSATIVSPTTILEIVPATLAFIILALVASTVNVVAVTFAPKPCLPETVMVFPLTAVTVPNTAGYIMPLARITVLPPPA